MPIMLRKKNDFLKYHSSYTIESTPRTFVQKKINCTTLKNNKKQNLLLVHVLQFNELKYTL